MIDRKEYSNQLHDVLWNIGSIEMPATQRKVLQLISSQCVAKIEEDEKSGLTMLQTSIAIREIPSLVEQLVAASFAIYEIRLK